MRTNRDKYKAAFSVLHASEFRMEELKVRKRNILKPALLAAACVIVCLAAVTGMGGLKGTKSNNIAIEVNAETLSLEKVALLDGAPENTGARYDETESGDIAYCIEAPFTCTGDNISEITYSVNRGAFQVNHMEGDNIIIDGKESEYMNVPSITPAYDSRGKEVPYIDDYYSQYTVRYDKQSSDKVSINVCGINQQLREKDLFGIHNADDEKEALNKLISGIRIKCDVSFQDGSTEEKVIEMRAVTVEDSDGEACATIAYKLAE